MLSRRAVRVGLFAIGALAVLSVVGVDPAALGLLLDVDLLVLLVTVGVAMLREEARLVLVRLRVRPSVVMLRAGIEVTRAAPRSLL